MMEAERRHYRFEGINIDLSNLRVTVNGEIRPLEPKSFRLLQFLIENRGRAVSKAEILTAVWADTFVTDNALTRAVAQIRKALDDDPKQPRYVETVPTIGYRFLPECETENGVERTPVTAIPKQSRAWWGVGATMALLLLGGGWWLARPTSRSHTMPTLESTAQLTASHGLDIDAVWSPDGSLVAYASDRSGRFEIYVRSRDAATRELQLTNDGNQNVNPSFSADGRSVAYSSMAKPGIYRIPVLGGPVQRLTDSGAQPKWSPNGKWIAFISHHKPSLSTTDYYFSANTSLCLVPAAGGAVKQLTETFEGGQTFPSWSSDSQEIRFVNYVGQTPSLWTYRMADGKFEKRFEGAPGTTFGDAVFSRDSTRMYYVKSNLNGDIEIWMQPLDPKTLRPSRDAGPLFRPTLGVPRGLSLSPDGKRLAFSATLAESKLLVQKMKGSLIDDSPPAEITHETTYRYAVPKWSPDGQSVIYTKFEKGRPPRTLLDRLDGSPPQMLGQGIAPEVYPVFTPDGKHVLVIALAGGEKRAVLQEISIVDGAIRELAKGADMAFLSVSPDGGAVTYHNPTEPFTHLYRLDLKTGARTQLTFGDQSTAFGYFSRDGKRITFSIKLRGRDELGVIPAQGGPIQVFWNEPGHWYAAGWTPSTEQVLASGNRGSGWALYTIDVKAKTARQLSKEFPLRMYLRYPEMSPDGKRIVYEFNESRGNVFVGELL